MKNTLHQNQAITHKLQEVKIFDHLSSDDMSHGLQQERENTKIGQQQGLNNLYKQLEEREIQEQLFNEVFGGVTQSELEELDTFHGMSAEEFDQGDLGYRAYEKNGERHKAAKYSMYYILHQRKDKNANWPYNDLLYRHVAQNLLRANEHNKAEKILKSVKNLSLDGGRKAIDDISYDATIAFASHDIESLEQLQHSEEAKTLDEFNKKTLDAMVMLGRQGVWDYGKVYGGL